MNRRAYAVVGRQLLLVLYSFLLILAFWVSMIGFPASSGEHSPLFKLGLGPRAAPIALVFSILGLVASPVLLITTWLREWRREEKERSVRKSDQHTACLVVGRQPMLVLYSFLLILAFWVSMRGLNWSMVACSEFHRFGLALPLLAWVVSRLGLVVSPVLLIATWLREWRREDVERTARAKNSSPKE